ncbi:MAG: hypothetical protein IKV32_06735 [Muribaculaceae bacterium]|nr:hypothetical protein [Muribaculaceae bacterium]
MKQAWLKIMLLSMLMAFVASCDEGAEPVVKERPLLSATTLSLEVGDSAILHVANADTIYMASTNAPNVVSVRIDGIDIIVKALTVGEANININVNGARLMCGVEVYEKTTTKDDFSTELNDDRCRFVSPSLAIYYDTPGTIFSIANNQIIEIRDLSTGDHVKFDMGTTTPTQVTLNNASLIINGTSINLKHASLEHHTPDGSMWFYLIDTNDNSIILVVANL